MKFFKMVPVRQIQFYTQDSVLIHLTFNLIKRPKFSINFVLRFLNISYLHLFSQFNRLTIFILLLPNTVHTYIYINQYYIVLCMTVNTTLIIIHSVVMAGNFLRQTFFFIFIGGGLGKKKNYCEGEMPFFVNVCSGFYF